MKKSITDLANDYSLDVSKEGNVYRAYCPFHNDSGRPNFTIYPETNTYYCFACGVKGDRVQFVADMRGISRAEAWNLLGGNNVDIEELQEKINGLYIPDFDISYNLELNMTIGQFCRQFMQQRPDKREEMMSFLKTFDQNLLEVVSYNKMVEIMKDYNKKFKGA